jgi:hypothetical protein
MIPFKFMGKRSLKLNSKLLPCKKKESDILEEITITTTPTDRSWWNHSMTIEELLAPYIGSKVEEFAYRAFCLDLALYFRFVDGKNNGNPSKAHQKMVVVDCCNNNHVVSFEVR